MVVSTSLTLSDYEQTIYTKMVKISPKYVLVNQMDFYLEVTQFNVTEDVLSGEMKWALTISNPPLAPEEKREWYWPNAAEKELLLIRQSDMKVSRKKTKITMQGNMN